MAHSQQSDDDFVMLSAYRDFFSQATDFSLSFARYRARGYEQRMTGLTWNGVPLENWENGSIPWSIVGNLSSISTTNTDHLATHIQQMQKGSKIGASLSNRTYTYRANASYTARNFSFDVSRRWGNSLNIQGVTADNYSFFGSFYKEIGNHSIELSLLYAPSDRTTQRASTQEAYELLNNNLYNPAWGWQSGMRRNVRQNRTSQPLAILAHTAKIGKKTVLETLLSARVGTEIRTALTWQNTPNPYPDYYRYMPSYQPDETLANEVKQAWLTDETVSQIDFQTLYNVNQYNTPQAKYAIEERRSQIQQYRLASSITGGLISGGFEIVYAKNRNNKRINDLMGATYWLDVDAFVEQDDDIKQAVQNNLQNPNFKAKVGDTFGYDYAMTMHRFVGWAELNKSWGKFSGRLRTDFLATQYQRIGYFEKENFEGRASLGQSYKIANYDYNIAALANYNQGGRLKMQAAIGYRTMSPTPSNLFLSREYRNAIVPQSIREKIATIELSADYRTDGFRAKGTLYYTNVTDRSQLMTFYDDNIYQYTTYWLQGIEQRYVGLEFSTEFDLTRNISAAIAIALSDNRYTSNPTATQWSESKGELLRTDETVYYENLHAGGSPENVAVIALKYSPSKFSISLSANYFNNNFISISPLRRTERSQNGITGTTQQKLSGGVTLDVFGGRTFYFDNNHSLGIWAGINNLTNNRNLRTGGYESYRTVKSAASDSRYYYALGINGFLSVTYRF